MNTKLLMLLGSAGALPVMVGGLFLSGGCVAEDPPMPPGIYVPKTPQSPEALPSSAYPGDKLEPSGNYPEPVDLQSTAVPQIDGQLVPAGGEVDLRPTAVPQPGTQPPAPEKIRRTGAETVYKAVKGDSLWRLSRTCGLTIEELALYNNLPVNAKLRIGQTLLIPPSGKAVPGAQSSPAAGTKKSSTAKKPKKNSAGRKTQSSAGGNAKNSSAAKSAKKSSGAAAPAAFPANGVYVVKAGDNFTLIARRFGLKVSDIVAANPGVDPARLQIGQKLQLAGTAPAVPAAVRHAPEKKTPEATPDNLLEEIPNPDAVLESRTAAPAAAPAAPEKKTPEATPDNLLQGIPNPDAALESHTAAPAAAPGGTGNGDNYTDLPDGTVEIIVGKDTTLTAFCQLYRVKDEEIKSLNPSLPLDGRIKAGTHILLP